MTTLRELRLLGGDDLLGLAGLVGSLLDGFEDAHVAGAAAEVSGEAFLDFWEGGVRVFGQEMMRGKDHAGGADAALRATVIQEALLDGVEVSWQGSSAGPPPRGVLI